MSYTAVVLFVSLWFMYVSMYVVTRVCVLAELQ